MRPAVVAVVVGTTLAVGIPTVWVLTRPAATAGPPVAQVLTAPPSTGSAGPTPTAPGLLPQATARPASPTAVPDTPAPVRLSVPRLGVDAPVDGVGVEPDGTMTLPEDVDRVGWYRFGPVPGSAAGSAVLAGHVDDAEQGLGALSALADTTVGDEVTVTDAAGGVSRWQVVARESFDKSAVPLAELFARTGAPRLVLITCGGRFLADIGSYRDNVVVVAEPLPAG